MNGNQSSTVKTSEKPTNPADYNLWLEEHLGVAITDRMQIHYEATVAKMKRDLEMSHFWQQLTKNLHEHNDQYLIETGYPLLVYPDTVPELKMKPWESFVDKTYRENVVKNRNWPSAPEGNWILPSNWYTHINDILRTMIVVKYLDGVAFLVDKLKSLCGANYDHCDWEAKEEGYYAVHLYRKDEFEIPAGFDTEKVSVLIEIQITTQIQEVIRKLLWEYYERSRSNILPSPEIVWQWEWKSEEFMVNYLGHILHYVEGMIMEIRDKEKHHGET